MGGFDSKLKDSKKPTIKRNLSHTEEGVGIKAHPPEVEEDDLEDDYEEEEQERRSTGRTAKVGIVIVTGVLVLVLAIAGGRFIADSFTDKADKEEPTPAVTDTTPTPPPAPPVVEEPEEEEPEGTPYTDNLTGSPVDPIWEYASSETMKDFCNYEKKRCVMGNGLELYWLDAVYKEMPYVIQINYSTYMMLDEKGIVPVIAENVTTSTEVNIITNMVVDVDYIKRLKK